MSVQLERQVRRMPSTKGYRSYHGKGGAGRIVLIVLLCLILLAAVGFLVLQRYAVYGSDGSIRFDLPMLGRIIRIGLPSGIQNSIIAFANVVVQSYINAFGEMAMAGYGAYTKIEGFAFLPINSFTMAMTTFVGQNLGAGQTERTRKGARFGILVTVVMAELIGVIVMLFAPQLIAAFDSTPAVVQFGVEKARTAALFYCLLAYSHSVASVIRGAGKAVVSLLITMTFWCVVRVAFLAVSIPFTHSVLMVYAVYPLTWALSSVAFFFYYRRANWLNQ